MHSYQLPFSGLPLKMQPQVLHHLPCLLPDRSSTVLVNIEDMEVTVPPERLMRELEQVKNHQDAVQTVRDVVENGGLVLCRNHECHRECPRGKRCRFVHRRDGAEMVPVCLGRCTRARHTMESLQPPKRWTHLDDDGGELLLWDQGKKVRVARRSEFYPTLATLPWKRSAELCADPSCHRWFWCEKAHLCAEAMSPCTSPVLEASLGVVEEALARGPSSHTYDHVLRLLKLYPMFLEVTKEVCHL
eukprot:Sspe_Gene.113420::Locus_97629_Transcript_1_1_Confidence_1.000_Length_1027::g.113420::m.113420